MNTIPKQIACIMDGNRRFTKERHLPPTEGHTEGAKRIKDLLWQCAYTELYFTDVLWSAFDRSCLEEALSWYHTQTKHFEK